MANRQLNQFQLTYEKDSVTVYAVLNVGAAGAVSSIAGGGVVSIAKQATAGQYLVTFTDQYRALLSMRAEQVDDANANIAAVQILQNPATLQADVNTNLTLLLQCLDFGGAAANPTNTSQMMLAVTFRKSSVSPYGIGA